MLSEWVGYFSPVAGIDERALEDAQAARDEGDEEWATTLEAMAPTLVPSAEQIAGTFPDKELTEEEETEWNDLFEVVLTNLAPA
jgi:hypothetical protein